MAGCEEQQFQGVTREHLLKFVARGAQFGLPVSGPATDHGEVTYMGVTVHWRYNVEAQTLAVQCIKSPMLLPCTMINKQIHEAVSAVMRGDATPDASRGLA